MKLFILFLSIIFNNQIKNKLEDEVELKKLLKSKSEIKNFKLEKKVEKNYKKEELDEIISIEKLAKKKEKKVETKEKKNIDQIIKNYKNQYNNEIKKNKKIIIKPKTKNSNIIFLIIHDNLNIKDIYNIYKYFNNLNNNLIKKLNKLLKNKNNFKENLKYFKSIIFKNKINNDRKSINLINYSLKTSKKNFILFFNFYNYNNLEMKYKNNKYHKNFHKNIYYKSWKFSQFIMKSYQNYIFNINKESTNLFIIFDKLFIEIDKINGNNNLKIIKKLKFKIQNKINFIKTEFLQLNQLNLEIDKLKFQIKYLMNHEKLLYNKNLKKNINSKKYFVIILFKFWVLFFN